MLKPLTTKMTDELVGGEYSFTFYCDVCGKPHRSPAYQSMTLGGGDEKERKAEYEDAYALANREMLNKFSRCPVCQRVVCDECFDVFGDYDMCVECRQSGRHGGGDEGGNRRGTRLSETQNDDSRDPEHRTEVNAAAMRPGRRGVYAIAATCIVAVFAGAWALIAPKNNDSIANINDNQTPLGALWSQADPSGSPKETAGLPRPDETAKPYTGAEPETVSADGVKIPGIENVTIPAGTADVHFFLLNPAENDCSLTFALVLKDTGETLFQSGLLAPGMYLEDVTLDRELNPGGYKAVLKIRCYAPEDINEKGGWETEFDLFAK